MEGVLDGVGEEGGRGQVEMSEEGGVGWVEVECVELEENEYVSFSGHV